ncbi:MAG TPA: hypothetical protein PLN33_11300 [Hyphomonadaceae bacterium]|nr:hypothetical protein [Hyphomonadaceae bacterium]HPN05430.1 hypothetical protein [Hyphomonadaceae bacterium]
MRVAYLMLAGLSVAGCSTSKPNYDPIVPFEASSPATFAVPKDGVPLKAVAFDNPINYQNISNPSVYNPAISPGAAAAGGAIAMLLIAAVDASIDGARNDKVNNFLAAQKFDATKVFHDALNAEMARAGHTVTLVDKADAVAAPALKMDVTLPYYGYQIVGGPWAPSAVAIVTVTSADGKEVLLKDGLRIGMPPSYITTAVAPRGVGGNMITLPYDPAYILLNEDAITLGDASVSIAGLRVALETLAKGVADLVRQEMLPAVASPVEEAVTATPAL